MKVAIFTDTYTPEVNGVAKTLERWTLFLEQQGIPCKVFAPEINDQHVDFGKTTVERFYSFPFLLYPEIKLAIPRPFHIKQTLKEFEPTIIHTATPFNLGLYGKRYALKNQIPFVASYHTNFEQYLPYYKIKWIEQVMWKYMDWFHQNCSKIYVPSESTLGSLALREYPNLEVWGRGVDTKLFHPDADRESVLGTYGIDPDTFVLLYVGRIAPEKSMDVLFDIMEGIPAHIRSLCHLMVVGDGPSLPELREKYGNDNSVSFHGFIEGKQLAELYAAADIFVFPSATETFGNVVLEAMASGTPVIGANAGGVKNSISHNETGILCEPGRVDQFVKAIVDLYENIELRYQLSIAGREYSLTQTWDSILHKLLDSYRSVVNSPLKYLAGIGLR
jgi:glycosyltransferase involved in cell wall biosynthesis